MDISHRLMGLTVCKVERVHDYIQIGLSDGATLSIFNRCSYDGVGSVLDIKGKRVVNLDEFGDGARLIFGDGTSISIGLGDEDYHGPEAMVLVKDGEAPVVWN